MPKNGSSNRLGRKGVDAIFTPTKGKRDPRFLIGLAGVLAGLLLWIAVIVNSTHSGLFGISKIGSYQALALPSLALIFVINGIGICLTYARPTSINKDSELEENNDLQRRTSLISSNLKLGLIAFLQSCFLVALYSGLSDEYQSNAGMQQWVTSILPTLGILFSWEAVMVVSAILGVLVVQFLPGRVLAE